MKILILYTLYDLNGEELTIGGIQTYVLNLAKILQQNGYEVEIFQNANFDWIVFHNNLKIIGLSTSEKLFKKRNLDFYHKVLKHYAKNDLLIFGTDIQAVKNINCNSIAIQHGVYFDITTTAAWKRKLLIKLGLEHLPLQNLRKKASHDFLKAKYQVCVDYNFLNWVRTMMPRKYLLNTSVIPNFTHINNSKNINFYEDRDIHILFARRFTEIRGTYILSELIDIILSKYDNVYFTIAGAGPLENYLKNKFLNNSNVTFMTFAHEDSLKVHSKHHISLIPTLGSEGTSLSLLESMTSGCVPIVSNVGGMTNIILNEFNGFIVNPNTNEFVSKLEILIKEETIRKTMSKNAKLSADSSFNYDIWKSKWLTLIKKIETFETI